MKKPPIFTDDFMVFGILMGVLALIFYTSQSENKYWKKFYTYIPSLLLCYLIPSILSSLNVIAPDWTVVDAAGNVLYDDQGSPIKMSLSIYKIASRFLLPAALILMTLSIDIKSLFGLGGKAIIIFFTGTVGIILGGPIAILIVSIFSPETVGGAGYDAVWRGLSTLAGSWIGGGANQTAMLEIYQYNQEKYGAMVLVDIVVANVWMAILLYGIGKKDKIDHWLQADNSSVETLKNQVDKFIATVKRMPTLTDYMILLGVTFFAVGVSHLAAELIPQLLISMVPSFADKTSMLSTFADKFFWLITVATLFGILFSYTPIKTYEGMGASKIGSIFIYILVASIGMRMDLRSVVESPGLIVVGIIWMAVHAGLLIIVGKLIKAPYFFIAVGSQANVGGAASAPIVAAEFHPSLASVGVLLAIFGYVIGTYGAIISAMLMKMAAP